MDRGRDNEKGAVPPHADLLGQAQRLSARPQESCRNKTGARPLGADGHEEVASSVIRLPDEAQKPAVIRQTELGEPPPFKSAHAQYQDRGEPPPPKVEAVTLALRAAGEHEDRVRRDGRARGR